MAERIKTVFILPSFHTGGSERVMLHLLTNFDRTKFDITLIVLNKEGELLRYLPTDIEIVFFNYRRTLYAGASIYRELKKRPRSLVFTTLNQLNLLVSVLAAFLPRHVFIARESSIVSRQLVGSTFPVFFKFLYNTTFRRIHSVICQSLAMKEDLLQTIRISEDKIKVINNPVDFKFMPSELRPENKSGQLNIITVGRLRTEKGYDRILDILARCKIPFHYKIIGDGPLEDELRNKINVLGLNDKVELAGMIPLPYKEIAAADLFIQGSLYEGFPNTVIEAHACGVPVFALEAPGGHNEIIVNGFNGYILSADEMVRMINERKFRDFDRTAIVKQTLDRYSLPKIISQYEEHFVSVYRRYAN